jgi:hypothetical protein
MKDQYFWFDTWLSLHIGDGSLECTQKGQSIKQSDTRQRSFNQRVISAIADQHTVLSTFLSEPGSTFSKVERAMCCMVFFMLAVFSNAFFYDTGEREATMVQRILVGIYISAVIVLPTWLVVFLFRRAKVRPQKYSIGNGLNLTTRVLVQTIPKLVTRPPENSKPLIGRMQSTKVSVGRQLSVSWMQMEGIRANKLHARKVEPTSKKWRWDLIPCWLLGIGAGGAVDKSPTQLPPCFRELAWLISLGGSVWVSYYAVLLSFSWGVATSWSWLTSLIVSILTMTIVTDPLIVIVVAFVGASIWGGVDVDKNEPHLSQNVKLKREIVVGQPKNVEQLRANRKAGAAKSGWTTSPSQLAARQARHRRNKTMSGIIQKLLGFLLLYAMLLSILYAQRFDGAFTLTGAVLTAASANTETIKGGSKMLSGASTSLVTTRGQFGSINGRSNFWDWCKNSIGTMRQNSKSVYTGNSAQLGIGEIYLIGAVRLRQLRVRSNTCKISKIVKDLPTLRCNPRWSKADDSHGDFQGHRTVLAEPIGDLPATWSYGRSKRLRASINAFGSGKAEGMTTMEEKADGSFVLSFSLRNVQVSSVGKLFVSTSSKCVGNILSPLYSNGSWVNGASPWLSTAYLSDLNGDAADSFTVDIGHGHHQMEGHTVSVLDTSGKAIGCGVLKPNTETFQESTSSRGSYHNTLYPGIGFSETLPTDNDKARDVIDSLRNHRWLDELTRSIVVEYTVYSPSVDYVATVQLLVETPPTGDALTKVVLNTIKMQRYNGPDAWVLVLFEFIVLGCTIYLCRKIYTDAKKHKQAQIKATQERHRCESEALAAPTAGPNYAKIETVKAIKTKEVAFFDVFENCIDVVLVVFCFATLSAFWIRQWMVNSALKDWKDLRKEDRENFFDGFFQVAKVDSSSTFISGATMIIATLKLIALFKHNLKVKRLLWLFQIVAETASAVVFQLLLVMTAYSFAGTMLLGSKLRGFSSVGRSYATLFISILGEFNAEDFVDDGFLTRTYFLSFQALGIFIVVNFFVAVLADGIFIMTTEMNDDEHVQYDLWEYIWSRTLDLVGIGKKVAEPPAIIRNIKVVDSAITDLDVKLTEMLKRLSEISNHMGVEKSVAVFDRVVMRARMIRAMSSVQKLFHRYSEDATESCLQRSKAVNQKCVGSDVEPEEALESMVGSIVDEVVQNMFEQIDWRVGTGTPKRNRDPPHAVAQPINANATFLYKPGDFVELVKSICALHQKYDLVLMNKMLSAAIERERQLFVMVFADIDRAFVTMSHDFYDKINKEQLCEAFSRLQLDISATSSQEVIEAISVDNQKCISIDELKKFIVVAKAVPFDPMENADMQRSWGPTTSTRTVAKKAVRMHTANYAKGLLHFKMPVVPRRVVPSGVGQAAPKSMPSFRRSFRGELPPAPPPQGSIVNAKGCLAPSATI